LNFESTPATVYHGDRTFDLEYIGSYSEHQDGISAYFSEKHVHEAVDQNSLGIVLLIYGYIRYLYIQEKDIFFDCFPTAFSQKYDRHADTVNEILYKWFSDIDASIFHEEKLPFSYKDDWRCIGDTTEFDECIEYASDEGIKLVFSEPFHMSGKPIFVKKELFQTLKEDMNYLYGLFFSEQSK
jgi:hypothetical protein